MAEGKLYFSNGFLNFEYIAKYNTAFNFIVGGRGIGKTYGALDYLVDKGCKFFFMRRTQVQIDTIALPEFSPFKVLNDDKDINIGFVNSGKYMKTIHYFKNPETGIKPAAVQPPIGVASALSTVSNIRGFDASDITHIVFDEFIPEKHEKAIKGEGTAFLNAYETINRNRELVGNPPVKVFALSNSNNIASPIFMDLGLVNIVDRMVKKGHEEYHDFSRGISVYNILRSPISEKKKETAVYKLAKENSEFSKMALSNDYVQESFNVKHRKLNEFKPVVTTGEVTIFKHKSAPILYVSFATPAGVNKYGTSEVDKIQFKKAYPYVWEYFTKGKVEFENQMAGYTFLYLWG